MTDPVIYQHDLKQINDLIGLLNAAICDQSVPDLYVLTATVVVESSDGHKVGSLTYSDEQWAFTPTEYGDPL